MLKASPSATTKIRTNPCATARWKPCASSGTRSPAAMAKPGRTAASTTRKAAKPTRAASPWKETTYSNSAASSAPPCSAAPPPGPAPNKPLRHGLFVGAPPDRRTARCEPGGHTTAPGGGSDNTGRARFICRSTAPGANRPITHSHPRRVLLQYGVVPASFVGAPPPVRTGPSHIRTQRVLLQHEVGRLVCRSTAGSPDRPGANGSSTNLPQGRRYFNRHPNRTINTAKLKYATAQLPADKLNNTGLANGVSPAMNRHTT